MNFIRGFLCILIFTCLYVIPLILAYVSYSGEFNDVARDGARIFLGIYASIPAFSVAFKFNEWLGSKLKEE